MRNILLLLGLFGVLLVPHRLSAQDCEIPMGIALPAQVEDMPSPARSYMLDKLRQMATANGISADLSGTQFFLSAKIHVLDKAILPGPPMQHSYTLAISLYVVDDYNQKIFSTATMEVKGIGNNENKAYINGIRRMNVNSSDIKSFIAEGKQKVLRYYDENYRTLLAKAASENSMKQYGKALNIALSVPPCSKGYEQALQSAGRFYQAYINQQCQENLAKAKTAWNTRQDAAGAAEAGEYLSQIYPDAACHAEAMALYKDIKAKVKEDAKFEMKQYNDAVAIEKQRLEMMKAVGVAYGKGPKESKDSTKIYWIK